MAHAEYRVFALFDILQQLYRGGESLLDVVAHFAVGGIARQQPPVDRTQPQLRHVVVI